MTQRIFDIENEKDMQDLWDILPDDINKITPTIFSTRHKGWFKDCGNTDINLIQINWHDKTEITRPIQEATEADVGKLCIFWNNTNDLNLPVYKILIGIKDGKYETFSTSFDSFVYDHARRLTKQEIEELC